MSNGVIPAGGRGQIEFKFNTERYKGRVTKYVTVLSNDPENPRLRLAVYADVRERKTK